MTQPDILMLLDDMTDTQRAIVLLLAKKIQEKETRAKQLGVEESHQRLYCLTTKDQMEILPDMPIAEATETIWWELSGLMKFSLHRSKKATGCCDRWITKYQKYQTNAIYIMIDRGMLDIYRKLSA
jgi:hypothetical protein